MKLDSRHIQAYVFPVCNPYASEHTFQLIIPTETTQTGLLSQGYVPEKHRAFQTQKYNLKQCISWGLGD
jgi:hypothetical protein